MPRRASWLFIGLFFMVFATLARAEMLSVSIEEANLRSGPGSNHPVQWRVIQGFPLETIKKQGNWIQVRDFEGDVTWVYAESVSSKPHVIVTGDTVNLRSQATTTSSVVNQVEYGTVLERLENKSGWVKVKINETVAWIHADFIWGAK